jgi:hypothetical protein
MSCDAERKEMPTAIAAIHATDVVGSNCAIAKQAPASSNWKAKIQARRRPSQRGSKRSRSGAHTNLKV